MSASRSRFLRRPHLSLRSRLLIVVFGGAIVPLGLLGLWLTSSAQRAGEELLVARLEDGLQQLVEHVGPRWLQVRSQLLDVAESDLVQQRLRSPAMRTPATDGALSGDLQARLSRSGGGLEARDLAGTRRWGVAANTPPMSTETLLQVSVPVHDARTGAPLGTLEAPVTAAELIPALTAGAAGVGGVLAAFDAVTGASLLPLPFEPALLEQARFTWDGEEWITRYRVMAEPGLVFALAAPLSPYRRPFDRAARQGALALLFVALISFIVVALLTRRFTRSLAELATAAEGVRRGELDRRVEVRSADEVGAVAQAFNTMTSSLRTTLDELARRQGLAAVGEFAASLAHEVRNPLSAIRLDLQWLEEEAADEVTREGIARALRHVQRLDATVAGSLSVARGVRIAREAVDLRGPIAAAHHAAQPEFAARDGTLHPLPELPPLSIRGDAAALEQLLLNLLLNAAQALQPGGEARIEAGVTAETIEVAIVDTGAGIAAERRAAVFEPFTSTRPGGTGLGLSIARRIAHAHGGDVELESGQGRGTRAVLRLPRAAEGTNRT